MGALFNAPQTPPAPPPPPPAANPPTLANSGTQSVGAAARARAAAAAGSGYDQTLLSGTGGAGMTMPNVASKTLLGE